MSEAAEDFAPKPPSHLLRNIGLALAAIYVVASLYLIVELRGRVAGLEKGQQASNAAIKDQGQRFGRDLKASTETLGAKLGMTQQELQHSLSARTSALERQQRASEERIEQEHKQAYTQVTGEVAGVKT